jgi:hypothetical protein
MTLENIRLFNVQTLRAIAHLYKSLPKPTTIEHSTLRNQPVEKEDGSVVVTLEDDENGSEAGTILWLHREGFVSGKLLENKPLSGHQTAAITSALLTTKALRILQNVDPNAGTVLGEFVVSSALGSSEQEAADLLVRRLREN